MGGRGCDDARWEHRETRISLWIVSCHALVWIPCPSCVEELTGSCGGVKSVGGGRGVAGKSAEREEPHRPDLVLCVSCWRHGCDLWREMVVCIDVTPVMWKLT